MSAREVVARALFAQRYPGVEWNPIVGGWALIQADTALAALAATPDVVERAARVIGEETEGWIEATDRDRDGYRVIARAALAAALGDGVVGERHHG